MLAKTALLIVTNPTQIGKILPSVQKQVKSTLYIQLITALTEPFGNFHTNVCNSWPKYSNTIYRIYSQAATHCQNLDVRVLLSGIKYPGLNSIITSRRIDLIIFDKDHSKKEIDSFVKERIKSVADSFHVTTLDSGVSEGLDVPQKKGEKVWKHTVLGGTFDRLHLAHKLLLSEAALRSNGVVTVGVTEENMLQTKTLWELIQPLQVRMNNVKDFLTDICNELEYNIVPISDPFGPAITDPSMNLIVVSQETLRGGQKINEIRKEKNLGELEVIPVKLIDEPYPSANEETKISSSTGRIRLLGTLLRPPTAKPIPDKPYVIGLTGGVASGKSGVAKWLSLHGAEIIDCDKIGHQVYLPGKACFGRLVQEFGERIVGDNGEIDRRVLGGLVFGNPAELKKLNAAVWPCIADEVGEIIRGSGRTVVVVEAAVLLVAKWDDLCHEVWSTLVPRKEAIQRLQSRNNLSEAQAIARLNSQPANSIYVNGANVVFCPLWDVGFTKQQVDKAWELLQARLL